jgi:IS5 family transposase
LQAMSEQVRAVVRQTKARVFAGITQFPGKLISLFEPHTEIIRKGKASKPNEFGKLVQVQEAENQIITHYEVYSERPSDRHLLLPAVAAHQRKLGRVPKWVAADAGFYSQGNEEGAQALGVKYVSIPNRNTRSEERRRWEKQRWFKQGQKWRTGCEGRISVIKRRHGLARCRYHGLPGMRRWVGLGVIADNLINIGRYLAPVSA